MQDGGWRIQYRFENQREKDWQDAKVRDDAEVLTFEIPIEQTTLLVSEHVYMSRRASGTNGKSRDGP